MLGPEGEALYANLGYEAFPLWMAFLSAAVLLPLALISGYAFGRAVYRRKVAAGDDPLLLGGETTLGAMLALLGLLLAFTYAFSLSRADARKAALTEEAAAIGTAFLRADLVAEPGRSELKEALLDYARTRFARNVSLRDRDALSAIVERTMAAQARLWPATLKAIEGAPPAVRVAVASGVTEVLDAHARRFAALAGRLPGPVRALMILSAVVALTLAGNRTALLGRTLTWRSFVFAAVLVLLICVFFDFERPSEGLIRVDRDALFATIADMERSMGVVPGASGG